MSHESRSAPGAGVAAGSAGNAGTAGDRRTAGGPDHPRPSRGRRALRVTGLAVSGLLVVGLTAGAAVLPTLLPDRATDTVAAPSVDLEPVESALACTTGPTATMGEAAVVDPAAAAADTTVYRTRLTATFPRTDPDAAPAAAATLDGDPLVPAGDLRLLGDDAPATATLTAEPVAAAGGDAMLSALASGSTVSIAAAGDLRGLAAWPCAEAREVTWHVGGSTRVGASTQVTLTNIGATPATAAIAVWGSLGPLEAPTAQNITVAPGESEEVLLEGAVAPDPTVAVRVDVRGGALAVHAQDLALDGLVPAGIAAVPAAAAPATELTVPGVAPTPNDPAVLRLVNPGETDADATITAVGTDGTRVPQEPAVVPPQSVLAVPLTPTEGVWAVQVSADAPVAAAAELRRTGQASLLDPDTPPVDRAWAPAAGLRRTSTFALPRTAESQLARLSLYSPTAAATVTVTGYTDQGAPTGGQELALEPGAAAVVDLPADAVTATVLADTPVASAAVLTATAPDGELIEVLPGTPDPHTNRSVRVALR